jgi:hypothetical protein
MKGRLIRQLIAFVAAAAGSVPAQFRYIHEKGKRMRIRASVVAIFAVSLSSVTQARAATCNWSYSDSTYSGSGTLTTTGANSPFTITSIKGSFDFSNSLQLLEPGSCCGLSEDSNDNLLYSSTSTRPALLDGNGLAFQNFSEPGSFQIF